MELSVCLSKLTKNGYKPTFQRKELSELLTTQVASFLRTPSLPADVFADSGNGYGVGSKGSPCLSGFLLLG